MDHDITPVTLKIESAQHHSGSLHVAFVVGVVKKARMNAKYRERLIVTVAAYRMVRMTRLFTPIQLVVRDQEKELTIS